MLLPLLEKGQVYGPPAIGDRHFRRARIVAVVCRIICSVTHVIGQMKGVGVAFSRLLETDRETGLYIGMPIVFLCRPRGVKGITYINAQYCVFTLLTRSPIFISLQLTGNLYLSFD